MIRIIIGKTVSKYEKKQMNLDQSDTNHLKKNHIHSHFEAKTSPLIPSGGQAWSSAPSGPGGPTATERSVAQELGSGLLRLGSQVGQLSVSYRYTMVYIMYMYIFKSYIYIYIILACSKLILNDNPVYGLTDYGLACRFILD